MKKKFTPTAGAHAADPAPEDDLHRHFQISLEQIRAGKGISAEESLRQLGEDLDDLEPEVD